MTLCWKRAALAAVLIMSIQGCAGVKAPEEKPGERAAQTESIRRAEWISARAAYYQSKGVPANKASAMAASDYDNRKSPPYGGKYNAK